jgi:phage gp29-like protein
MKMAKKTEQSAPKKAQKRDGYIQQIVPKAISRARSDIGTWKKALQAADNVDRPNRAKLYTLYDDILLDAHLTSKIEIREKKVLSTPLIISVNDQPDEELSMLTNNSKWAMDITKYIFDTVMFSHSLVEFSFDEYGILQVQLIPRNNVIPEKGRLVLKEGDETGISYRDAKEFGWWLLEFWEKKDYGLLNKAVPHVLFKRFAQACWSELCEIYAIPPRYIKTDTTNPEMLDRANAMLRDMGAAAYFIIDTTEAFEFAKGADTNGDVYNNLIKLCKDEVSMLINSVVIGEDTKNGNESKEEVSQKLLDVLVEFDKRMIKTHWNMTVVPALIKLGVFPQGASVAFQQEENLEKLWKMTVECLPYMNVDTEWMKEKFGIEVTEARIMANPMLKTLSHVIGGDPHFFD